ncbi:uncharacterized protein LOC111258778 [Varroa jacobsoni]|uniref:uncharacterized protein LOC111258778 n=1 Tax=Varroa jacobsoni TaxID=62625 RepID=UPI000BF82A8C|nr:uncharacterized protein LOC111258778 [Varroa jacobsoni]XP_022686047.1 uncharacterized protein LOC111258778 [Varroa jacobsoni]
MNDLQNVQEPIRGEVMLQICHDFRTRILYVGVLKARHPWKSHHSSRSLKPYAQCTLMPGDRNCQFLVLKKRFSLVLRPSSLLNVRKRIRRHAIRKILQVARERNIRRAHPVLSVEPTWNQTMLYPEVDNEQLSTRRLVVSLWSFRSPPEAVQSSDLEIDKIVPDYGCHDSHFFIGEVTVDLMRDADEQERRCTLVRKADKPRRLVHYRQPVLDGHSLF